MQIVMIDTVVLSGNSDKDWLGLQPHGPEDDKMADDQWMWITQQLATSTYVALEIIALTLNQSSTDADDSSHSVFY